MVFKKQNQFKPKPQAPPPRNQGVVDSFWEASNLSGRILDQDLSQLAFDLV